MVSINVRDLGAKGDGLTNDTTAFQKAAAAINAAGGGTIYIPQGNYVVGRQHPSGGIYMGEHVLRIQNCPKPVLIFGKQAKLTAAPNLRFGLFNGHRAIIYEMILLEKNAAVTVRNLELDGNLMHAMAGSPNSSGVLPATGNGISAYGNWQLLLENLHVHNHTARGLHIAYPSSQGARPHTLVNVVSEHNFLDGLSWAAGNDFTAVNCVFNHNGGRKRPGLIAESGAGIVIEPNQAVCENAQFIHCQFINNVGAGLLNVYPESNPKRRFFNCTFWGTTNWSVFVRDSVGIVFEDCRILGACIADSPGGRFTRCHFEDLKYRDQGFYRGNNCLVGTGADGQTFEDCTIVANQLRAVYADYFDKIKIFRNTKITHRFDNLPDGHFQSLFRGAQLENVTFKEEILHPPQRGWLVAADHARYFRLHVDGPWVKWNSFGQTGDIPNDNLLHSGEPLRVNQRIYSTNSLYTLTMQGDGNLVLYDTQHAIWSTQTNASGATVCFMQGDGNLVLYDAAMKPVWETHTDGNEGAWLALQDDRNLVIYRADGRAIWSSGTNLKRTKQ